MPPLLRPINATRTRLGAWPWRAMAATALALLLWDASDLDLLVMRHVGSPNGFPLRMNFWLENLLHIGGRNVAIALYLTLWVLALAWPARSHPVIGTRKQTKRVAAGRPDVPSADQWPEGSEHHQLPLGPSGIWRARHLRIALGVWYDGRRGRSLLSRRPRV